MGRADAEPRLHHVSGGEARYGANSEQCKGLDSGAAALILQQVGLHLCTSSTARPQLGECQVCHLHAIMPYLWPCFSAHSFSGCLQRVTRVPAMM
jgi:hypothetical protein